MAKYRTILFFGALMTLYFLVRWALIFGETGVLRWYFTDLLFVPAMCTFALLAVRRIKKDPKVIIPARNIYLQVLAVSLYFEWYLPSQDSAYTSDPWDVVMYILGGFIFLWVQRKL
ncbi:MAG: hypothetical protein Crog4KO_13730 [Crocinitomicaceae bacterium]